MGTAVLSPQDCLPSSSSSSSSSSPPLLPTQIRQFSAIPCNSSRPAVATRSIQRERRQLHQMVAHRMCCNSSAIDSSIGPRALSTTIAGFNGGLLPQPGRSLWISSLHHHLPPVASALASPLSEIPSPSSLHYNTYHNWPIQRSTSPLFSSAPASPPSASSSDSVSHAKIQETSSSSSIIRSGHSSMMSQKSGAPKAHASKRPSKSINCKDIKRNADFHPRKRAYYMAANETEKRNTSHFQNEPMDDGVSCAEACTQAVQASGRTSKENLQNRRRTKTSNHVIHSKKLACLDHPPRIEESKEMNCEDDMGSEKSNISEERWAGPSFFNSPPPSSLPFPTFSIIKTASVSCDHHFDESLQYSNTTSSPETFSPGNVPDAISATKLLRKLLNMDPLSG